MKRILLLGFMFAFAFAFAFRSWAQRTVSGTITSEEDGQTIPGVNVVLKGTATGTTSDIDGNYRISVPEGGGTLVFSFIGLAAQEIEVGARSVIDVSMTSDVQQLTEVVVTALGIEREERTLTYATQEVKSEALNITQNTDIKGALAGKVAGVQLNSQAGSKLGEFGKIRVRGAISLTNDDDPLYVIDGIPTTDPNTVDMNNVESISVLKGPNATSLYGQRASSGVVVITTKKGTGKGVSVQLYNSTTWDRVTRLPKYQNLYGGGYEGNDSWATFDYAGGAFGEGVPFPEEWQVFDGKRYLYGDNNYADESWGPRFDGQDYVPWYAWWPDSPYFGQTAKYEAQPDNIKDFYRTGVTMKNTVSISGGGENSSAFLSYSNLHQNGITPSTDFNKHYITGNFSYNASKKLTFSSSIKYATSTRNGDFSDDYGNQTSGSFNSWFARNTDVNKLRELKDLTTPDGYSTSWNWWGPDYYAYYGGGFRKPAFWFNSYTFMENYRRIRTQNNLVGSISAKYSFSDHLDLSVTGMRNAAYQKDEDYFPFFLANSAAPELYNAWSNSFGRSELNTNEDNFTANFTYNNRFGDFDLKALAGGNYRHNTYERFSEQMPVDAKTGGLIIPDVYQFSNAGILPTPETYIYEKKVVSYYGNLSLGYKDMLYLDASFRRDWSSALPADNNGYTYPSIGASFIFSELPTGLDFLSYGKFRTSYAQVGSDVDALKINQVYIAGNSAYQGAKSVQYTPDIVVDPGIIPAKNTSVEVGMDVRVVDNRFGLSATYYHETRKNDIIPISISQGSGYDQFLTNSGEVLRRGIELAFDMDIIKTSSDGFNWNMLFNFARNKTTIEALPDNLDAINGYQSDDNAYGFVTTVHEKGSVWGQLRGTGFARDENGNKIIQPNGLYVTEQNMFLGSVLPKFTGGMVNRFGYKGFTLIASIDYQKGGKFFSLSESWGNSSGLMAETAATNDKSKNVRDDVSEGGGVHVVGVNATGEAVDTYVPARSYFTQFYTNRLAEQFLHDASYIKLREVSLSYDLGRLISNKFVKNATVGIVGRNLAMLAVAKDNTNRWDPSVMAQTFGEDGQLPSVKSYGVNVTLTF